MGQYVFKLPDIGEGIAEAEIVAWHVSEGDRVAEGQALVDIMTDKATVEISAPVSGTVTSRKGELGSKARIGSELVSFETESLGSPAPAPAVSTVEHIEPEKIKRSALRTTKTLAAPAVRARAKSLGLDLTGISASGPEGRIRHEDLDRLLLKRAKDEPRIEIAVPEGGEAIPVFGLRRRIAERMQEASRRIPHFTYVEEVDVTGLEELRQHLNQSATTHLTILPFLIRAICQAVPQHPQVNAHYDDDAGVIHRYRAVHVGIATQTERGLLVPVIHNAQDLGVEQIADSIAGLSEAARIGKSKREDLSGSTITVTSLGALGGIAATPIVNPPEVAIIGVNRMAERPCVMSGGITIRKMMNLSSSFDHRIVDGFDAAAFINAVKKGLEQPDGLQKDWIRQQP
jgi:2-oxoisovalerate dehydrogenase E2 component (dihydrolipoyl transacylase)